MMAASQRQAKETACRVLAAAFMVVGCQPSATPGAAAPGVQLVEMPARPDARTCEELARADIEMAVRVRQSLGLEGVDATAGAAIAAADADISQGIPLLAAELDRIRAAGIQTVDSATLFAGLVGAHPGAFGDVWLDNGTILVSILREEPDLMALARCLERGAHLNRVRYVAASHTTADLDEVLRRIVADRDQLLDEGIEFTTAWTDPTTGTVVVGVRNVSQDIERTLMVRYGAMVRVIEHGGFQQAP